MMIIVLMGVSGSGKTFIGKLLGRELGWPFYDGDDFHPAPNVEKMSRARALTDEDRAPWLDALRRCIVRLNQKGENGILASSALKRSYRDHLREGTSGVRFVYLKGSYDLILERLVRRKEHFMKPELLRSQFAALEEPDDATVVDTSLAPEEILKTIRARLGV